MINELGYILITILLVIIGISDVLTRKIRNIYSFLFLGISLILFIINAQHSFIEYTIIILTIIVALLLFTYQIFGAADGKILIGASLITLSLAPINFFQFIFNTGFLFVLTTIILTIISVKFVKTKEIINATPYRLFLFQTLAILTAITSFNPIIQPYLIQSLWYFIIYIPVIFLIAILSKILHSKIDENTEIVIATTLAAISFYLLLEYFLLSLALLYTIRTIIYLLGELSIESMTDKKHGFAPPLVSFMSVALFLEIYVGQTFIALLF